MSQYRDPCKGFSRIRGLAWAISTMDASPTERTTSSAIIRPQVTPSNARLFSSKSAGGIQPCCGATAHQGASDQMVACLFGLGRIVQPMSTDGGVRFGIGIVMTAAASVAWQRAMPVTVLFRYGNHGRYRLPGRIWSPALPLAEFVLPPHRRLSPSRRGNHYTENTIPYHYPPMVAAGCSSGSVFRLSQAPPPSSGTKSRTFPAAQHSLLLAALLSALHRRAAESVAPEPHVCYRQPRNSGSLHPPQAVP